MARLRQKEVAAELEVSAETINRWEKGLHKISKTAEIAFRMLAGDLERVGVIRGGRKRRRVSERRGGD